MNLLATISKPLAALALLVAAGTFALPTQLMAECGDYICEAGEECGACTTDCSYDLCDPICNPDAACDPECNSNAACDPDCNPDAVCDDSCAGYDPCDESCNPDSCDPECYPDAECDLTCNPDAICDESCDGYDACECDPEDPECETETICDDDVDNDGDGMIDCADLDDCSNDPACNNLYGCTDECADNYDENATDDDDSCTYGGSGDEYGCCDDGEDNDGDDGQDGGGIDGTDDDCTETCADKCATNYNPQGGGHFCTDNNGDGIDDCCNIPDESSGEIDCCDDGADNDNDGTHDWCSNDANNDGDCDDTGLNPPDEVGDSECSGGGGGCDGGVDCSYGAPYVTLASCGGISTAFAGDATYDLFCQDQCPADADAALAAGTAQALASKGGICGYQAGDDYSAGGTSDSFYFVMVLRDECPLDPQWTTVPAGYVQDANTGHCIPLECVELGGDSDGDGLCDDPDPCDNVSDADIDTMSAANEAGLAPIPGDTDNCECRSFVRDREEGDEGEDVGVLQDFLIEFGSLVWENVVTRGTFDTATREGLTAYQTAQALTASGILDAATRAAVNASPERGGVQADGATYNEVTNNCEVVSADLCENIDGAQYQDWLDAHPGITSDGTNCSCGAGAQMCADFSCIPDDECCQPASFWYCPDETSCVANAETCPPEPNCNVNPTDPCCVNPNGVGCGGGSCRPGYRYCPELRQCFSDSTFAAECPVGCFPAGAGAPDPYAKIAEYCTVIAEPDGSYIKPWRVGTGPAYEYQTLAALDAFFDNTCNNNVPAGCFAGDLTRILGAQSAARTDGNSATPFYSIFGKVTRGTNGLTCNANPCEHGQECALTVGTNGRTSASCVEIGCDPCVVGSGCYTGDPEVCLCDPETDPLCCDPGDTDCIPEGWVTIVTAPDLIGANGKCLVVWNSGDMVSTEVRGPGIDNADRSLSSGQAEVTLTSSTLYKIVGTDARGNTREATDLCATNPNITEV